MKRLDYYVNLTMYKQECIQTDLTLCQGDYGQKLYLSGISDSRSAKIVFKKPDGNTVEYTSLIKSGDNYVHTFKPVELQAIGKVVADVKFYDSSSRESSQKFTFAVKADTINDSVKESQAYSDSIAAAQTEFNALIADMTTQVNNFIAQKIIYADTDLQTYVDGITSRANTAAQACEDIAANKVGISNTPGDATAYSGNYTQSLLDALQQTITSNTQSIQNNATAIATTNNNLTTKLTYKTMSNNPDAIDINGVASDYSDNTCLYNNSIAWISNSNQSSNQPYSGIFYIIENITVDDGVILQRAYPAGDDDQKWRMYFNGAWSVWK